MITKIRGVSLIICVLLISTLFCGVLGETANVNSITMIDQVSDQCIVERDDNGRGCILGSQHFDAECISDTAAIYDLNTQTAYGLAINEESSGELYVSDYANHAIYIYDFDEANDIIFSETIYTFDYHHDFRYPRDLAYAHYSQDGVDFSFLYVLTSYDIGNDGIHDSTLWRINLDTDTCDSVSLGRYLPSNMYSFDDPEVWGLTCDGNRIFITWDVFYPDNFNYFDRIKNGIIYFSAVSPDSWEAAKNGDAIVTWIPNSGYWKEVSSGFANTTEYSCYQHRGLASMDLSKKMEKFGIGHYLWSTVPDFKSAYADQIYLADRGTGRGIFMFNNPNNVYGLAYGKGYLWAVNRVLSHSQIYKIKVHANGPDDECYNIPKQSDCIYRKQKLVITSKANEDLMLTDNDRNIFAIPLINHYCPNQKTPTYGYDWGAINCNIPINSDNIKYGAYYPAGDWSTVQRYYDISWAPLQLDKGDEIVTTCEGYTWTSNYRHYVYPHLCNENGNPGEGYKEDDPLYLFDIENTGWTYSIFFGKLVQYIETEYGYDMAHTDNPYWFGRNILEFIKENYRYGVEFRGYRDSVVKNLANLLDGDSSDDNMSCTPAAFCMVGLSRCGLGIPSRWIGTSINRVGLWDDANGNGFLDGNEHATDGPYHRWAQLWMGDVYGWQRFDATPHNTSCSQFDKPQWVYMENICQEVYNSDLILTIGSGFHEPFIDKYGCQEYNAVAKYEDSNKWCNCSDCVEWYNARSIEITDIRVDDDGILRVNWGLDGDWDTPCPCGTCSQDLLITIPNGPRGIYVPDICIYADPHDLTARFDSFDLSSLDIGFYPIKIEVVSDSRTGCGSMYWKTDSKSSLFQEPYIPILINITKPTTGLYVWNRKVLDFPGNTLIIGPIKIQAYTPDSEGLIEVGILVDTEVRYTGYGEPYEWLWDETVFGKHTISVVARNIIGDTGTDAIDVWIFNI